MLVSKRIITDLAATQPYLVRWSLWLPFGLSLKLHQILRPDDDRCCHDHPWWFVRVIVFGGYIEVCGEDNRVKYRKPWRPWTPWRIYPCSSKFRHRITELPKGSSWTLALCGRNTGSWGFFTRNGWMYWRNFVDTALEKRVQWCDDGRSIDISGEINP